MDMLGLGVQLNFEDNMTSQINPLIRDLERLRQQAQKTTQTMNGMYDSPTAYGKWKRDMEDYRSSMLRTDLALLNISDRLIRATTSANLMSSAINRMQFAGNFQQMYSSITRVQRMLGNMGYGMSQMQKDMANLRAYNMLNYQMKDLQDRIKLTTQALKEMQNSPDSSKYRKEMELAQKSLQAYKAQLAQAGSLQNKLAETHGYGQTTSGGKPVLYEKEKDPHQELKNRLLGATMADMAVASNLAYNSLDRTGKMMVGLGYTTMEARQKLTQMLGTLQAVGIGLSQFLSLPLLIATAGIGVFASKFESAYNKMQARTLTPTMDMSPYRNAMGEVWADTPNAKWEDIGGLTASILNTQGNIPVEQMKEFASVGLQFKSAWDLDAFESLNKSLAISKKYSVDNATGYDLLALALRGTNGDIEEVDNWLSKNMGTLNLHSKEVKNAYETLAEANGNGAIQKLIGGLKDFGNALRHIWDSGLGHFVGVIGDAIGKVSQFTYEILKANPLLSKFAGYAMGAFLTFGILLGPIAVVTGFLIMFRNAIQGTALAVAGFNKGGLALLPPQAKMAMNAVKAFTVAIARLPQTLLLGAIPAMYTMIRQLPMLMFNIARLNPVMTALTVGVIAYSKNWFGIGDKIRGVITKIKTGWTEAKDLVSKGMGNEAFDLSQFSGMTQVFAKMQGTALIAKKVLTSIFGGTELKFETGEVNLMQQLGIEGFVNSIAIAGKGVKDFWDGFKSGVNEVFDAMKTFYGWMKETFAPVFEYLKDTFIGIADAISKAFGGDGVKSVDDILGSTKKLNEDMFNIGKMAGIALTAFLGFKLLKPLLSNIFKNPFAGFISSAKMATNAVRTMTGAVRTAGRTVGGALGGQGLAGNRALRNNPEVASQLRQRSSRGTMSMTGLGGMSGFNRLGRNFDNHNGRQAQANRNTLGVTRAQYNAMTPNQQARHDRMLASNRARLRGYDTSHSVGRAGTDRMAQTAQNARGATMGQQNAFAQQFRNGTHNGRTVHERQTGRFRRALFGQAYDTFDEQGRRREVARQGGLFRRQRNDARITDRASMGERISRTAVRASDATTRGIRRAGSATASAVRGAGSAVVNSNAMKPITVPIRYINQRIVRPVVKPIRSTVNWVTGRLRTAGVIRQASTAGTQSGNRFTRAFNMATRTIGRGGAMFAGAVRGAGTAGARAGNGMLRGMGFVSKGIGGIFKLGFKLIPFLGWALMAWDIISAIFTNWDAIVNGAKKAWEWIKNDGKEALGNAWDWIKTKAGEVWNWILTDGVRIAGDIGVAVTNFIGQALTWLITKAGEVFMWILTDGIAMAVSLGADILVWAGKGFTDLVGWALGKFGEIVGAVWEIGSRIGSNMLEGIKSTLGAIGGWISETIGSAVSGVKNFFGGGGGKEPKKYARGGIINTPHLGLVGEAGPEAIIPLSGNQRNRARMLLDQTAGVLGMSVVPVSQQQASIGNAVNPIPTNSKSLGVPSMGVAREVNNNLVERAFTKEINNNNMVNNAERVANSEVFNNSTFREVHNNNTTNSLVKDFTREITTTHEPIVQKQAVEPIVRKANPNAGGIAENSGSQDNSVTIQNLNLNIKDGKEISESGAKKHAITLAKELQKLMKQERLRGNGKNLTLEDLILNL